MKKEFTLEKTYEMSVCIEVVKKDDKYIAKVKRDFDGLWNESDEYECWIEDDGQLMTEMVSTEEEWDAIVKTFCSYIKENGINYARICDKCGNGMNEGYIVYGGDEYYCSAECLHQVYTPKQWQEMYDESEEYGGNDNYWTQWEDELDCNYVLFNNQLINIE
jgi:hypothetical protein